MAAQSAMHSMKLKPSNYTNLKARIEHNLQEAAPIKSKVKGKKSRKQTENAIGEEGHSKHGTPGRKTQRMSGSGHPGAGNKKASHHGPRQENGKKRLRNGRLKEEVQRTPNAASGNGKSNSEMDLLRAEILALGGTEDDLQLVGQIDSQSEVEGEASSLGQKPEKNLRGDMKSLMAKLDIEKKAKTGIDAASSSEGKELSKTPGGGSPPGTTAPCNKPTKADTRFLGKPGRGPSRLVSSTSLDLKTRSSSYGGNLWTPLEVIEYLSTHSP